MKGKFIYYIIVTIWQIIDSNMQIISLLVLEFFVKSKFCFFSWGWNNFETFVVLVGGMFWTKVCPSLIVSAVDPNKDSLSKGLNSKFGTFFCFSFKFAPKLHKTLKTQQKT